MQMRRLQAQHQVLEACLLLMGCDSVLAQYPRPDISITFTENYHTSLFNSTWLSNPALVYKCPDENKKEMFPLILPYTVQSAVQSAV